jgi:hypothetical protein
VGELLAIDATKELPSETVNLNSGASYSFAHHAQREDPLFLEAMEILCTKYDESLYASQLVAPCTLPEALQRYDADLWMEASLRK